MVIKLTTLILIIGCMHLSAGVFSQNINLSEKNVSLKTVFNKLEKQTGYTFFYNAAIIKGLPNVDVDIRNATIEHVLDQCLSNKALTYSIVDKTVVIERIPGKVIFFAPPPVLFIGKVVDEHGDVLSGVTVKVKDGNTGIVTDANGQFSIVVLNPKSILQFSYIGFVTLEVAVKDLKNPVVIKLKEDISNLDQVQILAYSTTTKRLNTGSSYTIKADEIAKNPVSSVLQVLENRVPGLSIVQTTGQAGGAFTVRVRGINGLNTIDPLYGCRWCPVSGRG